MKEKINYLDLFSGCGGFHKGLEQAGFRFDWVGHSEVDKYACQVYHNHYPESECLGDVKEIRRINLPRIDLITFGFPCQDLSIAGKGGGLEANRSGLFYEAMRLVRAAKPKVFIFENVKGLLTKSKPWFANILKEVANTGLYDCEWQLLNTRWVLPQNRERLYFIGHFGGQSRPKVFPFREASEGITQRAAKTAVIRTFTAGGHSGGHHSGMTLLKSTRYPLKFMNRNQKNIDGDYAFTVDSVNTGGVKEQSGIRRLTPIECARLQGFPDDWHKGLSDTQAYKIYGNAVTVNIVELIARRLLVPTP